MLKVAIEAAREAGRFLKLSVGKVRNVEQKKGEERNLVSEIDRGCRKNGSSASSSVITRPMPSWPRRAAEAKLLRNTGGSSIRSMVPPTSSTACPSSASALASNIREKWLRAWCTTRAGMSCSRQKGFGRISQRQTFESVRQFAAHREPAWSPASPYDIAANPDAAVERSVGFLMAAQGVRRLGSAALDLAYVAAGRFDGFWEVYLNPWDMAAGALFVREAGGMTTDLTGAPLNIYRKRVVASNGIIHQAMLDVLRTKH